MGGPFRQFIVVLAPGRCRVVTRCRGGRSGGRDGRAAGLDFLQDTPARGARVGLATRSGRSGCDSAGDGPCVSRRSPRVRDNPTGSCRSSRLRADGLGACQKREAWARMTTSGPRRGPRPIGRGRRGTARSASRPVASRRPRRRGRNAARRVIELPGSAPHPSPGPWAQEPAQDRGRGRDGEGRAGEEALAGDAECPSGLRCSAGDLGFAGGVAGRSSDSGSGAGPREWPRA